MKYVHEVRHQSRHDGVHCVMRDLPCATQHSTAVCSCRINTLSTCHQSPGVCSCFHDFCHTCFWSTSHDQRPALLNKLSDVPSRGDTSLMKNRIVPLRAAAVYYFNTVVYIVGSEALILFVPRVLCVERSGLHQLS